MNLQENIRRIIKEEVGLLQHSGEDNLQYLKDMIEKSLEHPKSNSESIKQSELIKGYIDFFRQLYGALKDQAPHMIPQYSFNNIDNWKDLGNDEQIRGMTFLMLLKGLVIDYNLLGDEWRGLEPNVNLDNSNEVHKLIMKLSDLFMKS